MTPHDHRREMELSCPHCGTMFSVPKSMKGGIANCPECRRTVQVSGGYGAEFWLLWSLGAGLVLFLSAGAYAAGGLVPGIVTLLIGGGILTVITYAV